MGRISTHSIPTVAARMLAVVPRFIETVSWMELGKEVENRVCQDTLKLSGFTEIHLFFLNKFFSDFYKSLVNIQRSEKVDVLI